MLRKILTVLLVSAAPLIAQAPQPPAQPPSAGHEEHSPVIITKQGETQPEPGANLPATAPVITIQGLCAAPAAAAKTAAAKPAGPCKTVISKAQFEKIIDAVVPKARRAELPPMARQQIAHQFATLLVMAGKAKQKGVENDPNVKEQLTLSRDQVLASAYNQKLLDEAQPTDAEEQKYYDANKSSFDEATLQRLYIPKGTPSKDKPVDADAEKAAAQKLHDRAASGEDFAKLQKQAFANQPNAQSAPSPDMGPRRRGSLPPDQESAVFALKPNDVSALLENPAGWYVYKVTAKRTLPFAEVKEEIGHRLQQQKYMDLRNGATNSADIKLNEAYFGAAEHPEMEGMPGMRTPPSGPSSRKPGTPPTSQPAPQPQAPQAQPNPHQ
jgi:parvulin-like peptidyl-prolyl isomerase